MLLNDNLNGSLYHINIYKGYSDAPMAMHVCHNLIQLNQ